MDFSDLSKNCYFSDLNLAQVCQTNEITPFLLENKSSGFILGTRGILQQSLQSESAFKFEQEYNFLISNNLIQKKKHFCSECGTDCDLLLKCGHYICQNCIYSSMLCKICNTPKSFYDLDLPFHICMKCKSFKKRDMTCKHYCKDCVISKLRYYAKTQCSFCAKEYLKSDFSHFTVSCDCCGSKGLLLNDFYLEICNWHVFCLRCYKKSVKNYSCLHCGSGFNAKQVYKYLKKLKFNCEICIDLKDFSFFQEKSCCQRKVCSDCFGLRGCPCEE